MIPRALTLPTVAFVVVSVWLWPGIAAADTPGHGPDLVPADDLWRDVLGRAVTAAAGTSYEASMVVVTLDDLGPGVTEVEVLHGGGDDMSVAASESWLIARQDTSATYRDDEAGTLIKLGQIQTLPFLIGDVDRTYDVAVAGRGDLQTGPAVAVTFQRRGVLRERLFVDDTTGLVVRRETYGQAGQPVRVTALTGLRVTEVDMTAVDDPAAEDGFGTRRRLSPDELAALDGHDFDVPTTIGDGFDLRAGFALGDDETVQLLFSDGLYTVTLYEQPGRVDGDALDGAVRDVRDGIPVYRWPGAEPVRMVWNGHDQTFTAVSDAPADVLLDVVADLPHDAAPSMTTRIERGLARLVRWLWPFD